MPLRTVYCILVAFCAPAAAEENRRPSIDEIIAGCKQAEILLLESKSLTIRYERTKNESLATSLLAGAFPSEWTVAYREGNWRMEHRFTKPYSGKDFVVPGGSRIEVARDNLILEWTQHNKQAVLSHFGQGRNLYAGLAYFTHLGIDVPSYIAASGGVADKMDELRAQYPDQVDLPFLPESLRANRSRYEVLAEPDAVDGLAAWVVVWPGMDRFWVVPDRGFAIVRRKYSWAPGKPTRIEVHNSEYKEVRPGLWLPFVQRVDRYASYRDRESIWGQVVAKEEYRLRLIEFDKVADNAFDVELPTGTRVLDAVQGLRYIVADANHSDPFDAAIGYAGNERTWSSRKWVIMNVALLAFLSLFFIHRFRRSRLLRKPA